MAVAPGQVGWRRLYFTLALERELVRFPGGRWAIVVGGGPTLGVVSVSGSGFPVDRSTTSADAGVELGARLERAFAGGRLRGWLAATTVVWLRRQEVAIIGADPSVPEQTLPRVEPVAVLGVTVFPGW